MSDFSKETVNRTSDEFSRYCREEGLDRWLLLSRLKKNKADGGQLKKKQNRNAPHETAVPRFVPEEEKACINTGTAAKQR